MERANEELADLLKSLQKEVAMRKIVLGVAAAGALFAATAVPALAQVGVYAGPGGLGVELGAPGYYYGAYPYYGYYDYAPGWNDYYAHPGWHGWYGHHFVHHW
jgi:hypothetical protein